MTSVGAAIVFIRSTRSNSDGLRFAVRELVRRGVAPQSIHLSLERNMKCAVGFCGHCQYGSRFICKDGPVFRFTDVASLFEIREV